MYFPFTTLIKKDKYRNKFKIFIFFYLFINIYLLFFVYNLLSNNKIN